MTAAVMTTPSAPHGPPAGHLPYATPVARPGAKAWAGAAILSGGLCLILLGGCFLIGVMAIVQHSSFGGPVNPPPPLTGGEVGLMVVLYGLAFLSFGGAVAMLFAGARGLLRVMRS